MFEEIKNIIIEGNSKRLIETAEEIGNQLGRAGASQIIEIFRLIDRQVSEAKRENNYKRLHLIRPKLVYIIARISPRERPALERYMYSIVDGIHAVNKGDNENEKKIRIDRFKDFIEAVTSFYQYSTNFGAIYSEDTTVKGLRDKILELQNKLGELLQFFNMSTEKVKVFISHSHKDKLFAEQIKKDLEKEGIATWYDDKDLDIGDIVSKALSLGIEESYCFLIIISPNSVKSNWVKFELDEAYEQHINEGKKILPVVIGDLHHDELPRRLKKHLFADFRQEYEKPFKKLLRSIIRTGAKNVEEK